MNGGPPLVWTTLWKSRSMKHWSRLSRPLFRYQHQCVNQKSRFTTIPKENFGFAFDIDGVLVRGGEPIKHTKTVLEHLKSSGIPYILLTNGGGPHENERARKLSQLLQVQIPASAVVQSHTPFADMEHLKDKTVLVVGGEYGNCRDAALQYGFKNVVTTSDIWAQYPRIWPFSDVFDKYHKHDSKPQPLPKRIDYADPTRGLKIDAILVFNDPRDWGLDSAIILDCLLSQQGYLGSLSSKNDDPNLPNRGYQQDGQPPIYFSNADMWFAATFPLPRLGQGAFRVALEGIWAAATGGAELQRTVIGKPSQSTYEFAEKRLMQQQKDMYGRLTKDLQKIYMIGDNPESDIKGANEFKSPSGCTWSSILVKSGVYSGGEPSASPTAIVNDALEAVQWGMQRSGWNGPVLKSTEHETGG